MKIIIGLGNPERDYKGTRHNVGFEAINKFAYDNNIEINKAKFRSHIGEGHYKGEKVILVKPQTYMNLSGEAIRDILAFYKLTHEDIVVICDDCNLDIGDIRIRKKGTSGGQNGLKNIIYQIETDEFTRIRIGVGEKPPKMDLSNFVLSVFKKDEMEKVIDGITKAVDAAEIIIKSNVDDAMNKYNKKKILPKKEEKETTDPKEGETQHPGGING